MISIERVSKHFGAVCAVDAISLTVADGQLLTLLGPSGCGKTTTLRMIAGLEQNDAGRIAIGDRVVSDPASGHFVAPERREIGMVFQSYAIWPHMTVFANVAYPLEVRRRPGAEVRERVRASLRLMEMEHLADRPAVALSGGQQRLGITTVYVTHDQEEAMVLSDEIAVMHEGRVLQVAAPETVYTRPANRTVAAFVGMPNLLPAKIREIRRASGGTLARVEGDGWEGWCVGGDDLQAGDGVTVIVRPEVIQLDRAATVPAEPGLTWRGVVRQRFFRGTRNLYTVEVGSHRFNVDAPPDQSFVTGVAVSLAVTAAHTWAVRE